MRILMVNKFFYRRGGADVYALDLISTLEEHQHHVVPFSMLDSRNIDSQYSSHFVSNIDFVDENNNSLLLKAINGVKVAKRVIWSSESKDLIDSILREHKPHVAHLNNIHYHISPSILPVLKKHGVPIVWTLHDLAIICPNSVFMDANGNVCEECAGSRFYKAVLKRCKKGSYSASGLAAAQSYYHSLSKVYDLVDVFIAPSMFLKKKIVQYGIKEEKVVHIPNFAIIQEETKSKQTGNYCVYFGRLSSEKGLNTLLSAMEAIGDIKLLIVGNGPLRENIENQIKNAGFSKIELLGELGREELNSIIEGSLFTIIPSECYENCPLAVLESFALGKPVIGSDIGGIPELIEHGKDGLLFKAGDVEALKRSIQIFIDEPNLAIEMGQVAKRKVSDRYNVERHYQSVIAVYEQLVNGK